MTPDDPVDIAVDDFHMAERILLIRSASFFWVGPRECHL